MQTSAAEITFPDRPDRATDQRPKGGSLLTAEILGLRVEMPVWQSDLVVGLMVTIISM